MYEQWDYEDFARSWEKNGEAKKKKKKKVQGNGLIREKIDGVVDFNSFVAKFKKFYISHNKILDIHLSLYLSIYRS